MKKVQLGLLLCIMTILAIVGVWSSISLKPTNQISGAPPYGASESEIPPLDPWQELKQTWTRPVGPPRVGLQIGHLDNDEVPEELDNLRGNTGAQAAGYTEVAVNQVIVEQTANHLRAQGIVVDILPATIPPDYWADAFIAVHADGNLDTRVSGYKIAAPWRDLTGKAGQLVTTLETTYEEATGLVKDPNISRNMRGYYAFSWWKFEHSIHPMTPAVIVETGFLTNRNDRQLIAENPHVPAQALADGIVEYLKNEKLLQPIAHNS